MHDGKGLDPKLIALMHQLPVELVAYLRDLAILSLERRKRRLAAQRQAVLSLHRRTMKAREKVEADEDEQTKIE